MTAATAAAQPISKTFTRAQVADALISAGNDSRSTDADIRRLTTVHFHMIAHDMETIDGETLDDEMTVKLLDYFIFKP